MERTVDERMIEHKQARVMLRCKYARDDYLWLVLCEPMLSSDIHPQFVVWMYNSNDDAFFSGRYFKSFGTALHCYTDLIKNSGLLDLNDIEWVEAELKREFHI